MCVNYLQTVKASITVEDYQTAESGTKRKSSETKKEFFDVGEKDNKYLDNVSKGDNTESGGRQHFLRKNVLISGNFDTR